MSPLYRIIKFFLIWRVFLFLPVIFGASFLNYGSSFPFFEISYYKDLPLFLNNPIFKIWSNFDGVHYLNIAAQGYTTEARFFPLFPLLIFFSSLGSFFYPLTYTIAVTLPNLFAIAGLSFFYKLLRLDYSERVSLGAINNLLIFPTSFFLVSVYSESLFLLLLLSCFYFSRKKNWPAAVVSGFLLCCTRLVGIFIIPVLMFEFLNGKEKLNKSSLLTLLSLIFIVPLGLIAYAVFNLNKWGNPLYFLLAQTELGNSRTADTLVTPIQTLFRYSKIYFALPPSQFEWWIAIAEAASFVFGSVMLYVAWKKKIRTSYLIFAVPAFLMPVFSGTFSGLPRYLLVIFPVFVAVSLIKIKVIRGVYLSVCITLLFILLMFFSRGYFIA